MTEQLQEVVDRLVQEHAVPGAVVAFFDGDTTTAVASGVANRNTGAAMTPDTLFLIGSVTKVWVTTLLMTLVDSGKIELDVPVRSYLPAFRLADPVATDAVTVRHLLTHASGIDAADYAPDDLGRGADAVAAYVDRLGGVGQVHAPGAYSSYCNPGFVVAGRLIEVMTETPFDTAFRERLFEPLGLTRSFLSAEDAILHRVAVGHLPDPDGGPPLTTSRFMLPSALGPAGSTLMTTVADAVTFARLHLDGGTTQDGQRLLSEGGTAAMSAHQIDLPVPQLGSFGLGWGRREHEGTLMLSHGGGSFGGLSQLIAFPTAGVALAAFANSSESGPFHDALRREVVDGVLGIALPGPFVDDDPPAPPSFFAGTYRRRDAELRIDVDGDGLVATHTPTSEVLAKYDNGPSTTFRIDVLGGRTLGLAGSPVAHAVGERDGRPEFVFLGGRLSRRVED
jgi:CubicO group peptidase (beta-lactamase class C family)